MGADETSPFFKMLLFHETRDGHHVLPRNICPKQRSETLNFLRCGVSTESIRRAILQWRADDLESQPQKQGSSWARYGRAHVGPRPPRTKVIELSRERTLGPMIFRNQNAGGRNAAQ